MKTSIEIIECYDYSIKTKISCRISSAKDMLHIERRLETQQETQGLWDVFFEDMHEALSPYNLLFSIQTEYLIGSADVIFEIDTELFKKKDVTYKEELLSEEIAGAFYRSLFEHFGFNGWHSKPKLVGYRYQLDEFKKLSLFKDNVD